MKLSNFRWYDDLVRLLTTRKPEPVQQASRIAAMQLHIVLPAKAGVIAVVLYFLFFSGLYGGPITTRTVVLETLQWYTLPYILCNVAAGFVFFCWRRFPPGIFQWLAFTLGILDGLFVAGVTWMTGGFASTAYWVFLGLIVLNAISIPLAAPQIALNLLLSVLYLGAGILDANIEETIPLTTPGRSAYRLRQTNEASARFTNRADSQLVLPPRRATTWDPSVPNIEENPAEPYLLRVAVLWLLTACCYGVQVMVEQQRRAAEEAHELGFRQGQLRSAGRVAAEFAHQIKNPLAIINNAAYSLQRALKEGRNDIATQIQIIQEEVERSDRIVTQIMGYAQLTEGRVEKLDLLEQVDNAVGQVFPPAAGFGIQVRKQYQSGWFPTLLMQRRHLSEIVLNLLQNAREALDGQGEVTIRITSRPDSSVEMIIADNGPGIPPDKLERIFEAYYTSKAKGSGLGLAIVKHNIELYGGSVRVESVLGNGARFIVILPSKTVTGADKPR